MKDAELYKLGHPGSFHYLNKSKTYELEGTNNEDEYWKTKRAMDIVGISRNDQVSTEPEHTQMFHGKRITKENQCILCILFLFLFQK